MEKLSRYQRLKLAAILLNKEDFVESQKATSYNDELLTRLFDLSQDIEEFESKYFENE